MFENSFLFNRSTWSVLFFTLLLLSFAIIPTIQTVQGAPLGITFLNASANQVLKGIYKVEVKASDTSLVSNIKLYVDGAFFKTENSSPYEFNIVSTNYQDGNHVLKAIATDKSGNTDAAEATRSVSIDNVADTSPPAPVSGDSTAPVTTASPRGGSYNNAVSVTLTASEPAAIYYTLNGAAPTLSSPRYVSPLSISNDVTLKFYGIDSAGNVGNIVTEAYDINILSITSPDGIVQIYPSKSGGNEWYMNMANPTSDKKFDPKTTLTRNSDGSWKVKSTSVRANVFTTTAYDQGAMSTYNQRELAATGYMQSPNDWKNVEMTGYMKLNAYSKDDNFAWYMRGGMHGSEDCEGTAYKGDLYFSGKERFAKEQWHSGGYSFSQTKTVTEPIKAKWIGYKFIVYNIVTTQGGSNVLAAKLESWIDKNDDGNWIKVDEKLDAGGWGNEGDHCGGAPDQIITWGGPVATFRWDSATDVDLKYLSVREIVPPT